jgi:hypothetical protein
MKETNPMKTTTVQASELGDDWRPSAHMPRVLTEIKNVLQGDVIRVRDHRDPGRGEGDRRWHQVTVEEVEIDRSVATLMTSKWPIAYVASSNEVVELVEIRREVVFRCTLCTRPQDQTRVTVTLDSLVDTRLMHSGGLHVLILPDTKPTEQTGYCKDHGTSFLS